WQLGGRLLIEYSKFYSKEEVIQLTQKLIQLPSHKDVSHREKEVVEYIGDFCTENGLDVEYQDIDGSRKNVIVHLKGEGNGKTLMLNGHTDTVPPYNMIIDPYGGENKDGIIWGRGA